MSEYISSEEGLTEHEKLEYIVVLICNEAMRSGNFEDLLDLHEIEASVKDRYPIFRVNPCMVDCPCYSRCRLRRVRPFTCFSGKYIIR